MGPKKPPNNGFYYLMLEHVENERKRGRNITLLIAQTEVGDTWKNMNKEERQPYNDQARSAKQCPSGKVKKYTSDGRDVDAVIAGEKRKAADKEKMLQDIRTTVDTLKRSGGLASKHFYILHVNYFCKTLNGTYIPAEIAILRFNFQDGETSFFHEIISPAEFPSGYRFDALDWSDQTHKIPFKPYLDDRGTYAQPQEELAVVDNLLSFLEEILQEEGRYPQLYVHPTNVDAARQIMSELVNKNTSEIVNFRIYDISYLLYDLKNAVVNYEEEKTLPSITSAIEEINRDVNCFISSIACDYHRGHKACEDHFQYCSLSIARRLMYLLSDHCCHYLGIELLPGKHCHEGVDTTGTSKQLSHAASGYTSVASYADNEDAQEEDDDHEFEVVRRHNRRGVGRGIRLSEQ